MRKLADYGPSLVVLVTAMLVLFLGPSMVRQITFEQSKSQAIHASQRLEGSTLLEQLNASYRDVALLVEPSVVHISAEQVVHDRAGRPSLTGSSGSGWVYDDLGHIVTNAHVIEDATRIQVQLQGGDLREAELVGRDVQTDIAVLTIEATRLQPALLGASESVRQGDQVFAFGSPFDFRFSMSTGIVSGLGRSAGLMDFAYEDFIQVDAAINPGNSGGPLTDINGRVIGMNTAIATGRNGALPGGQFAGIGLAIPMSMIRPVIEQLLKTGDVAKGYLGVDSDASGDTMVTARRNGFNGQGFGVRYVEPDGPADKGGLLSGDVITHIDDRPIAADSSAEAFIRLRTLIGSRGPGEVVTLKVWRFDSEQQRGANTSLTVTLGRLDPRVFARGVPELLEGLGLRDLATSTKQRAAELGITHHRGVVIGRIAPGSVFENRVPPSTTVVAVQGRPIANLDEFYLAISRAISPLGAAQLSLIRPDGGDDAITISRRTGPLSE